MEVTYACNGKLLYTPYLVSNIVAILQDYTKEGAIIKLGLCNLANFEIAADLLKFYILTIAQLKETAWVR